MYIFTLSLDTFNNINLFMMCTEMLGYIISINGKISVLRAGSWSVGPNLSISICLWKFLSILNIVSEASEEASSVSPIYIIIIWTIVSKFLLISILTYFNSNLNSWWYSSITSVQRRTTSMRMSVINSIWSQDWWWNRWIEIWLYTNFEHTL